MSVPPVNPDSLPLGVYGDWPGIDEPGHVRVDRARLRAIARRLETHLEEILSADRKLEPAAPPAYGTWDAARRFHPSVQAGHDALLDQHRRFLHAVMQMIENLYRSAHAYDEVEAELKRRIAEIDRRLKAGSTTDPSRHVPASGTSHAAHMAPNSLNPERRV